MQTLTPSLEADKKTLF